MDNWTKVGLTLLYLLGWTGTLAVIGGLTYPKRGQRLQFVADLIACTIWPVTWAWAAVSVLLDRGGR